MRQEAERAGLKVSVRLSLSDLDLLATYLGDHIDEFLDHCLEFDEEYDLAYVSNLRDRLFRAYYPGYLRARNESMNEKDQATLEEISSLTHEEREAIWNLGMAAWRRISR